MCRLIERMYDLFYSLMYITNTNIPQFWSEIIIKIYIYIYIYKYCFQFQVYLKLYYYIIGLAYCLSVIVT